MKHTHQRFPWKKKLKMMLLKSVSVLASLFPQDWYMFPCPIGLEFFLELLESHFPSEIPRMQKMWLQNHWEFELLLRLTHYTFRLKMRFYHQYSPHLLYRAH